MSRTTGRRLIQSVLSSQWAILPEWLTQFAGLATRLADGGASAMTADELRDELRSSLAELNAEKPTSLMLDPGVPLGRNTRATVREGVAIIQVNGPLYHYADSMHDVCGCTSYEQLAADVAAIGAAHDAGTVRAALFQIDSPGGEVAGCADAARLLHDLATRMPTAGFVSAYGCSAAYWLGAALGKVVVATTGVVGSIGIRSTFRPSTSDAISIVSSQSPRKEVDAQTDEGRAELQALIDALADVFVDDVARFRGVDRTRVLTDFGAGGVFVGQLAVDAGLADEIGTFESTLSQLTRGEVETRTTTSLAAAAVHEDPTLTSEEETEMPVTDQAPEAAAETDSTPTPEATSPAPSTGPSEAEAERARIVGILALPGDTALKQACIEDPTCSVGDAAQKLLMQRKATDDARAQAQLDARAQAEEDLESPGPSSESSASEDDVAVHRLVAAAQKVGIATKTSPAAREAV